MKGIISILTSLLVLPAFADFVPEYYDEIAEYTDRMINSGDDSDLSQQFAANRASLRAGGAVRAGAIARANTDYVHNNVTQSRTTNRAMVSRTTNNNNNNASRSTTSRTVGSRGSVQSRGGAMQSEKSATSPAVRSRVGANTVVTPVASKKTSGKTENSDGSSENSNARMASTRRASTMRIATAASASAPVDVATTTANLSALAELTDYCKTQYASCMDNYCNVLDDNQGRCTCSKNVKNYEKVEDALAQATTDFQDVIQKIKYIGLTGEQVTSLFEETEAEIVMANNKDTSKLTSSLDSIKRKIIDASSPVASSSVTGGNLAFDISGLLSFDLSSAFDLNSFLGVGSKNTTTSVANQRGEQLYKSATARCKVAVLDSCTAQGVEGNVIVNAYDLEIDKHCIAYERSLNEANDEMRDNVRNAGIILQQARLMLAQNRNSYDFRGCVAAIDACMQDEYVCGADYELCLDPTGKYIANGEIVKGSTPGVAGGTVINNHVEITDETVMNQWQSGGMYELYATWNYDGEPTAYNATNISGMSQAKNAWGGGQNETLGEYIEENLNDWKSHYSDTGQQSKIARFLLQKVGYIDANGKTHGMCAGVMKQCQDFTYTTTGSKKSTKTTYNFVNDVIRQYLQTTLIKIKIQQDEVLSKYAEDCQSEVTACLSSNGFEDDKPDSYASSTALGSCRTEIQTCMSVSGQKPTDNTGFTFRAMRDWLKLLTMNCNENYYVHENADGTVACLACAPVGGIPTVSAGGHVTRCSCPDGYYDVTDSHGDLVECALEDDENGPTITSCAANQYLSSSGCVACVSGSHSAAGANACTCDSGTWNRDTNTCVSGGGGGGSTPSCNTNQYLNNGSCSNCPTVSGQQTVSAGGSATYCTCPSGFTGSPANAMPTSCTVSGGSGNSCTGNQYYNGSGCSTCVSGSTANSQHDGCVCTNGQTWNSGTNKCPCTTSEYYTGGTCKPCPEVNGSQTSSSGGYSTSCSCPSGYEWNNEGVCNQTGGGGEYNCAVNHFYFYLTGDCESCGEHGTSAGGDVTQCTCSPADEYSWDADNGECAHK